MKIGGPRNQERAGAIVWEAFEGKNCKLKPGATYCKAF